MCKFGVTFVTFFILCQSVVRLIKRSFKLCYLLRAITDCLCSFWLKPQKEPKGLWRFEALPI